MTAVRILIVGETRLYRDLLASALCSVPGFEVSGTASNWAEARARIAGGGAHIALIDTGSPQGTHLLRLIASSIQTVPIVALAVPEHENEIIRLVEAGVAGYVTRESSIEDLLETVRRVSDGEAICSPRVAATLFRRLAQRSAREDGDVSREPSNLTSREFEIVDLIAEGLSNKEIARRLYIELPTVKNHVHNILSKLQVSRRLDAVASVRSALPFRPGGPLDLVPLDVAD